MNTPAFAVPPFVQASYDLFDGARDSFNISLFVAANDVVALPDDVAVPAFTDHVAGRICRLHRYYFVVFRDQGDNIPQAGTNTTPLYA